MGSQPDKVTQSTEPPAFLKPYIQDVLRHGQDLYRNFTPQFFPGSTVAPLSPYTSQGVDQLANFGNSPFNLGVVGNALGSQQGLMDLSGNLAAQLGGDQALAASPFYDYLRARAVTGDVGDLRGLDDQTTGAAKQALQTQLTTQPGANPFTDELVSRVLEANTRSFQQNVLPSIQNQAQATGLYGGSRQGVAEGIGLQGLADANARTASDIYSREYQADQARNLAAINQGLNFGLGQAQTDLGFRNALTQQALQGSQLGQGLLVPGLDLGRQGLTTALALSPALQGLGLGGTEALLRAGDVDQGYRQNLLDSEIQRFNFYQNLPWQMMQNYANVVYGLPGLGGSTTSTPVSSGGFAGALGGAATGASLLGELSQAGLAVSSPVGWGLLGLSALLGAI